MQITFDHNDLANPDTLAILRRILTGHHDEIVATDTVPRPLAPFPALTELETPAVERAFAIEYDVPVAVVTSVDEETNTITATLGADSDLLDSAGNMWDARIHASTRTKISDGTWKLKRGVDPQLIAQVLGGASKVEAFAAAVDPATIGFGASEPVAPPPPAAPAPVAVDGWPVDLLGPHEPGREFAAFMRYVMQLTTSGASTQALLACCKEHGVGSFGEVNGRTDIMPALARALSLVSTNKGA